ncbi:hypothetical protein YC2023_118526 [Brassica napus]
MGFSQFIEDVTEKNERLVGSIVMGKEAKSGGTWNPSEKAEQGSPTTDPDRHHVHSRKQKRDTRRKRITSAPYTTIEVVVGSQIGIHRNIPEQDARTTHLTTIQVEKNEIAITSKMKGMEARNREGKQRKERCDGGGRASQATLKEPSPAGREAGQVVAEEAAACQSRSPITGSQSRRRNRRNHDTSQHHLRERFFGERTERGERREVHYN